MKERTKQIRFFRGTAALVVLLAGWFLPELASATITAPYTNNFENGAASINVFTPGAQINSSAGGSDTWSWESIGGTNGVFQDTPTVGANASYAVTSSYATTTVANLGGNPTTANNFVESTDVVVTNASAFQFQVGLVALATVSSIRTYSSDAYFIATFFAGGSFSPGRMQIGYNNGEGNGGSVLTNIQFAVIPSLNTKYHLTLTGTYDTSGNLTLSFAVSDGTHITTLTTFIATTSVVAGSNFGMFDYIANSTVSATGTAQYDNYSLSTIPRLNPGVSFTAQMLTQSNMCLYYPGEPITAHFSGSGVTNGWNLQVVIEDADGNEVSSNLYPINVTGTWSNDVSLPNTRLGFYRLYATLVDGSTTEAVLPAVGSRPAGFMTYSVVPDPRQRQLYPENETFFGMEGGFNAAAGTDLLAYMGWRWVNNGGWDWAALSPSTNDNFNAATSPLPAPVCNWATDGNGSNWLVYNIPNLTVNGMPYGGNPDVYKPGTFAYNTGALLPQYYSTWSNFCRQVAIAWPTVYTNQPQPIYEITWEPIFPWGYLGGNADLVTMYNLAYGAIHSVSTNALVIGPCMDINSYSAISNNLALFDLTPGPGLLSYIDGFSAHPYMEFDIAENQTPFTDPELAGQPGLISTMKQWIYQGLGHNIPMFGTEQGYPTRQNVSWEIDQARRLVRQNLIMLGEGWRVNIAFYPADYPSTDSLNGQFYWDWGFFYNLATNDYAGYGAGKISPKPVAAAYSAMTFLLEGHKSDGSINWLGDTVRGYAYEDYATGTDVILALWDFSNSGSTVTINTGVTNVTVYDWMGNAVVTPTPNGQLTLNLSKEPTYVRGVAPSIWGSQRPNLNVAQGKSVTVSSTDPVNYPQQTGALAVDGDTESTFSRWVSTNDLTAAKWIVVNLGANYPIDTVRFWTGQYVPGADENCYQSPLTSYQIQYWDGSQSNWVTVVNDTTNTNAVVEAKFSAPVTTSQIRLYTPAGSSSGQVQLYELQALVPTPTVSNAPALNIELTATNTVVVSWPSSSFGYELLQTTNLTTKNWVSPVQTVNDNGMVKYVVVPPSATSQYYRLRNP